MKRKTLALSLCVLLAVSLFSCGKQENDGNIHGSTLDSWSPREETYDLEKASNRQKRKAELADLPEANETDFTVETVDGGVQINAYTGTLTAFRIPELVGGQTVVAIGDGAFENRTDLTALSVPESVTTFGKNLFKGCNGLKMMELPLVGTAAEYFGFLFGADSEKNNARDVPAALELVSICEGTREIGEYAFYDCNDLLCVVLPESVNSVGKFAFCNCLALEEINVDRLVSVGQYAFCNCRTLEKLDFGQPLETLGFASMEGCAGLRSLTLPFIGTSRSEQGFLGYAFGAETPETAVGFYPSQLVRISVSEGCDGIGNNAFYKMENLQAVLLPEGIREIGVRAFDGCEHLCEISIPASVERIGENAFFGCLYLKKATFADSSVLSKIGINCFYNCRSLTEIKLPSGLTELPHSCFAGCDGLVTVDFGGVKTVGKNAFRGCVSVQTVIGEGIAFEDGNECVQK